MLVVAEHWPVAGELLTSAGRVVLEHQLGVEVETHELSRQTLRCGECVTCVESSRTQLYNSGVAK